ncbi:MAG: DUF3078 domain-containing protein [bacterium]
MKGLMTLVILVQLLVLNHYPIFAQEEAQKAPKYGWKNQIVSTLNLTQASFENWTQGGENTFAWQINLNTRFVHKEKTYVWANEAKFTFGLAKVGDKEARKSSDEIRLESVYTRNVGWLVNPFFAGTVVTQFAAGFQYDGDNKTQVSKFLDPGYFTQSIGFGYARGDVFKTRLGATVKETVTNDFPAPYADDPNTAKIEKTKTEPGISSVTNFQQKLHENILYTSKLDMFSDLEAFNRIDVLWENNLAMKVTKLINVSFNVDLFYDRDLSSKRQIKQVLAIGFTYTFL